MRAETLPEADCSKCPDLTCPENPNFKGDGLETGLLEFRIKANELLLDLERRLEGKDPLLDKEDPNLLCLTIAVQDSLDRFPAFMNLVQSLRPEVFREYSRLLRTLSSTVFLYGYMLGRDSITKKQ